MSVVALDEHKLSGYEDLSLFEIHTLIKGHTARLNQYPHELNSKYIITLKKLSARKEILEIQEAKAIEGVYTKK